MMTVPLTRGRIKQLIQLNKVKYCVDSSVDHFGKGKATVGRKRKQPLEESSNQETSGTRRSNRKRKLPATVEEQSEQSDPSDDDDTVNPPQDEGSDNQDSHNLSDKNEESVEE